MKKAAMCCLTLSLVLPSFGRADEAAMLRNRLESSNASDGIVKTLIRAGHLHAYWLRINAPPQYQAAQQQGSVYIQERIGYIRSYYAAGLQEHQKALAALNAGDLEGAKRAYRNAVLIWGNPNVDAWMRQIVVIIHRFEFFLNNGYYPGERPANP